MPITVLPPETAAKIAAGEVVERPVSVAKELIENSLDSGATRVDIEVRAGGIGLLRVVDNGSGIPAAEAPLAFRRYATSKLASADDLGHITTHGFRGEALPSIAAVSEVTLLTRPHDELGGTYLRIEEGKIVEQASRGAPPGTSITVRDLFRNVPARLKFLKSNAAEAGRIAALVSQYALAFPEVHFSLSVDGRTLFESEGSGDLRQVAIQVFGMEAASAMLPAAWEDVQAGVTVAVHGLVTPPSVSRSNRSYINLYVNRRIIQNRSLAFAVEDAYQGLLMVGRHPIAVLNLTIDPSETDVNVHPSKMEIKFRDEGVAFGALRSAVGQALAGSGLARPVSGSLQPVTGGRPPEITEPGAPITLPPRPSAPVGTDWKPALPVPASPTLIARASHNTAEPSLPSPSALPILRPLGQIGRTYIISEGPDGLYLVDQHAAHERILFDRLRREGINGAPSIQALLEPVAVDLTQQQWLTVGGQMDLLRSHGFDVELFGQRSLLVRAMPSGLPGKSPARALLDLFDGLTEERVVHYSWEERLLTVLACHTAIRAGQDLGSQEQSEMLRLLEGTDNPRTCPHGRPTTLHLSSSQLEHEFGRT